MVIRGTQVFFFIEIVQLSYISNVEFFLEFTYLFCWPDADTDSKNVTGWIQIHVAQNA